jgi:hypothetical protein
VLVCHVRLQPGTLAAKARSLSACRLARVAAPAELAHLA